MTGPNRIPDGVDLAATTKAQSQPAEDLIVASLQAGHQDALALLYARYYREMVDLAVNFLHDPAAAEEIVQDTWAAIIEGIGKFKGRCSFKTWAFKILLNKAKWRYRRECRLSAIKHFLGLQPGRRELVDFDRSGFSVKHAKRWQATPEELLLSEEFRREMQEFIASLPSRQRQVFILRDIEGWAPESVCEVVGIRIGNQRVLLHRARAAIYEWYSARTHASE